MSEIRFRFAAVADAPRIVALAARVFRGHPVVRGGREMHPSKPTDLPLAMHWIQAEDQWVLLAEIDGALVSAAHPRCIGDSGA